MQYRRSVRAAALALSLFITLPAMGNPAPSNEELYQIIRELQAQVEALKRQVAGRQPPTAPKQRALEQQLEEQQKQIEALADEAEQVRKQQTASKTKLGGYGELHYNNLEAKGGVNPSARDREEIDFHRFVLYVGHDFNDQLRFRSELELEHALSGDGEPGEVELEQAYIEYDVNDRLSAKGGLFLIPVGILNETHEPPTFYGVERNPVESAIIPTTWWAGGAGLTWRFGEGWALDAAIHEGLKITAANFAVRGGRQKTAEADAEDLAGTLRVKWTGMPGLELAAAYQHQRDITQSADPTAGSADLLETHAIYKHGPFGLRALYAVWDLGGSGPAAIGADEQEGYYIEPSWRFSEQWGAFLRYNQWDNQAGSGGPGNSEKTQYDVGVNFWPVQNVVIKADYQKQDNENEQDLEGFNLGIGYQF